MARIRHLAILTEDVERLVRFYTTAFDLKIVDGVGTATYLSSVVQVRAGPISAYCRRPAGARADSPQTLMGI